MSRRRNRVALLALGLVLAACGLSTPTFPDGPLTAMTLPEAQNHWFACTPGLCKADGAALPSFALAPERLLDVVRRAALAQPRTSLAGERSAERRLDFVQVTRWMRFVDSVSIAVGPLPDGRTGLAIYSHSNLGRRDFGANRARVEEWTAAIVAAASG